MEFWYVKSRGLCKFCGKKNCPKAGGGECSATKLQIHKFQNDELLNLVKQHADNAANAANNNDDQGAHGATRDSSKAKKSKAAKKKGASTANSTGKLDVKEKHALLDKMGERTNELKALMACGGKDTHPPPESTAPREDQATANLACAETCRLVCTETSEGDLGDCDDIGFAGVVEQCLDNLSEGTLGEAFTTQVMGPPGEKDVPENEQ